MSVPGVTHANRPTAVEYNTDVMAEHMAFLQAVRAQDAMDDTVHMSVDRDHGTYVIAEPDVAVESGSANLVAEAITDYLKGGVDPDNPDHDMHDAFKTGMESIQNAYSRGVMATAMHLYPGGRSKNRLEGVVGAMGIGQVWQYRQKGVFNKRYVGTHLTSYPVPDRSQWFMKVPEDLERVRTTKFRPKAGDRYVMISQSLSYRPDTIPRNERIIGQAADGQATADLLVGKDEPAGPLDRAAILIEIKGKRRGMAGLLGALGIGAAAAGIAGAFSAHQTAPTGTTTQEPTAEEDRFSRWRRHRSAWKEAVAGAGLAGAAAASGGKRRRIRDSRFVTGPRGFGSDWRRHYTESRAEQEAEGYTGRKDGRARLGAMALGAAGMGWWEHRKHKREEKWNQWYARQQLHPRYTEDQRFIDDPTLINQDIERRRERNVIIAGGVIIAGLLLYEYARSRGWIDLNWSNRSDQLNNDPVVPHINMSHDGVLPDVELPFMDGDWFGMPKWWPWGEYHAELIPGHLPGQYVAPIPIQKGIDPNQFLHDYINSHPGIDGGHFGGNAHPGPIVATGPDRDIPPYDLPGSPATQPPAAPAPTPAPTPPVIPPTGEAAGPAFTIEHGNGLAREIRQYADSQGHHVSGAQAFRMYLDAKNHLGGNNIVVLPDGRMGTYIMPNGDYGISEAAKGAHWSAAMKHLLDADLANL